MKVAVIDNYDSFVYNLVRYVQDITEESVPVFRNDKVDYSVLDHVDAILLSPGPGIPNEAGDLKHIIQRYAGKKKILGVCLGHQAIAEVFGGELELCESPIHGKATPIKKLNDDLLFELVPIQFEVGRYHSWRIKKELPSDLIATAISETDEIMAIRHTIHDIRGIQFHPESILTPFGRTMIENWLKY
jgi:anthranilate synthase component 2